MGNLCRIAQPARDGAPSFVLERVKGVRSASNFGAIFVDAFDELFGDGAAPDLIEVFDLGKKLTATGVELVGGR